MANCIKCGGKCGSETILYVMEWSDNIVGNRQIQQASVRGAVKAGVCDDCMAKYVTNRTKGILVSKKQKEAGKAAIRNKDFGAFIMGATADAIKQKVEEPNAGRSRAFAAWAAANAADHLINETFIPAEYVVAALIQDSDGNQSIIENVPIKYILNRPSDFKFIQYNPENDTFAFTENEQWIDPKWLGGSTNLLHACREFIGPQSL